MSSPYSMNSKLGPNSPLKLLALEIEDDVIELIREAGRGGLAFQDGAHELGLGYDEFYNAVHTLASWGRVKVEHAPSGNKRVIIMPDWDSPTRITLTANQRAVLDFLCSQADKHNEVVASRKHIKSHCGVSLGSTTYVLDCLDYKGFLKFINLGGPTYAARFKVFPKGDGPRGYSWRPLGHNRRLMD